MSVENLIFKNLVNNDDYARKVVPHLKADYFSDPVKQSLYKSIYSFIEKYNSLPTKEGLLIEIDQIPSFNEESYSIAKDYVEEIYNNYEKENIDYCIDVTEEFCQDRAIYLAIHKAIKIVDGKEKGLEKGSIPSILSDALSVSFDNYIGHDYLEDWEKRFEFYHRKDERIPFDIEYLNKITKGGLPKKTLTSLIAPINIGKSLIMCHFAAANLAAHKNVLYITLEMAEERISERIDANLLNVSLDDIEKLSKGTFKDGIARLKSKIKGKLIVKEYPPASASVMTFRHLLNELRLKKKFIPDIIYVDYINLMASSRIKDSSNTYNYIKSIAEELRGLAVESNLPVVTATQVNRGALESSDLDMADTSESVGLPATLDLFIGVMQPEEMAELGQYLFKQLKNRFGDKNIHKRFVVGVDKPKMRLFDVENGAQTVSISEPVMDNTGFGQRYGKPERKFDKLK